jgi:hypothetical protein
MARYYFDVHDGTALTRDEDGVECCSLNELRFAAIDALPDLARDQLPNGDSTRLAVKVRDAGGKYLFEASLTLSVKWAIDGILPANR